MAKKSEVRLPGRRYVGDPAPLVGPQTQEAWYEATMRAIRERNPSEETKREYRKVLELFPPVVSRYGDLASLCQTTALQRFDSQPMMEEAIKVHMKTLRTRLAGEHSSPTETLLIDAVLACYCDYWTFSMLYQQRTSESFTLRDAGHWERVLASKEARYLRAVETLARVRRLLKLPAVQVNIGGQQINVAGDVQV